MSGYEYSDALDDDFDEGQEQQTGKGLRAQLEQVLAANKALTDRLDRLEKAPTLDALLKEKGIDPGVAALIPSDSDPAAWLEKHKHLLASGSTKETPPNPTPEVTPPLEVLDADLLAEQEAMAAMQQSGSATGTTTTQQDPFAQIAATKSYEEMVALIDAAKGGSVGTNLLG